MITLPALGLFGEFLRGKPYDQVVGKRLYSAQCPLVCWLCEVLRAVAVTVDSETVEVLVAPGTNWQSLETPAAYAAYIEAIDLGAPGSDVTVAEARVVLAVVLRELEEAPVGVRWEEEG